MACPMLRRAFVVESVYPRSIDRYIPHTIYLIFHDESYTCLELEADIGCCYTTPAATMSIYYLYGARSGGSRETRRSM